jgi:endonuclease YncB( thermonuclease family)
VLAPALAVAALAAALLAGCGEAPLDPPPPGFERVDHVADGDTVILRGGVTVRLVQIDTPEVFFRPECFGAEASAEAKRLLPRGTLVRLVAEPATEPVDQFGRLLRYVVRDDGVDVNLALVADGFAAPYFFEGRRGDRARVIERLAEAARRDGAGLWGACPGTPYKPTEGVGTGPPP